MGFLWTPAQQRLSSPGRAATVMQPAMPIVCAADVHACVDAAAAAAVRILEVMADDDIALTLTPQAFHNVNVSGLTCWCSIRKWLFEPHQFSASACSCALCLHVQPFRGGCGVCGRPFSLLDLCPALPCPAVSLTCSPKLTSSTTSTSASGSTCCPAQTPTDMWPAQAPTSACGCTPWRSVTGSLTTASLRITHW